MTIRGNEKVIGSPEKEFEGYVVGTVHSASPEIEEIANNYRNSILKKMISLTPEDVDPKLAHTRRFSLPDELHVSVKRDGEHNVFYYDIDTEPRSVFCNAPNGRARYNLPVNKEIEDRIAEIPANLLKKVKEIVPQAFENINDIQMFVMTGEMFANIEKENDRPRVFDFIKISRGPESHEDLEKIHYDIFDVLAINDVFLYDMPYEERIQIAELLFPREVENKAKIIEHEKDVNAGDIHKLFENWVNLEYHEGLVIRTRFGNIYKVKKIHTVDVAIIGFVEMLQEKKIEGKDSISTLLTAVRREDGSYQILCKVGGGVSFDQRIDFYNLLQPDIVESDYRYTKSDGRAFRFVEPKYVIQMKYNDLIDYDATGMHVKQMVLNYDSNGKKWNPVKMANFVSIIAPRFELLRTEVNLEDYPSLEYANPKSVDVQEISIDQILDVTYIEAPTVVETEDLPKSEIAIRLAFEGDWRGDLSAKKILLIQTNKHEIDPSYSAYVLVYVDYNHTRKQPYEITPYPFDDKEKAISYINEIFNDEFLDERTHTKLKGSIVKTPFDVQIKPDLEKLLDSQLNETVRNILQK